MSASPLTCWVMTEGIAGTENQCLGVAEAMGLSPVIKRVKLRAPWKQLSPWLRFGHGFALAADSDRLDPPYPDVLIASGRKAIGLARHIKKQSGGKTYVAIIQDPRINPVAFDLVAVPQHDPTRGPNVVVTRAALHRVTPDKLTSEATKFAGQFDHLPPTRVAVLIGGNTKRQRMTAEITQRLCDRLAALAARPDVGLMITASRRTGAENEAILRQGLTGKNIVFWDGQGSNPYFAFLATATHILVTQDSVSMTSEALSTGKPVMTIALEGSSRRHALFHSLLQEQGFTRLFDGNLQTWSYPPLNDTLGIAHKILDDLKGRA